MPQDQVSGATASAFGHRMGKTIAHLLGAELVSKGSNEVIWNAKRAVIKSCRIGNGSFGITTSMLSRLELVLVAVEDAEGAFKVYALPIERFTSGMRDSLSGRANGTVKLRGRREAETHGRAVAHFSKSDLRAAGANL